jgi:hypothetical protein
VGVVAKLLFDTLAMKGQKYGSEWLVPALSLSVMHRSVCSVTTA